MVTRSRYQYKPDVSISLSPRVTKVLRNQVNQLCRRSEMPEADVLRYCFEAVVMAIDSGRIRLPAFSAGHSLDAMVSIRTSAVVHKKMERVFTAAKRSTIEKRPGELVTIRRSDVARGLLEMGIALALKRGMAHIVTLRQSLL